jgi:hypothetical protein
MAMVRPEVALEGLHRCIRTPARRTEIADRPRFGRGPIYADRSEPVRQPTLSDDLRLFAITFAAGFLFVSILIG